MFSSKRVIWKVPLRKDWNGLKKSGGNCGSSMGGTWLIKFVPSNFNEVFSKMIRMLLSPMCTNEYIMLGKTFDKKLCTYLKCYFEAYPLLRMNVLMSQPLEEVVEAMGLLH